MKKSNCNIESPRLFSRRGLLACAGLGLVGSRLRAQGVLPVNADTTTITNSFAHIAYGTDSVGSWKTSFIFINTDASAATVQLLTYAPTGAPLAVPVVGGTSDSQHQFDIPAGGSIQVDLDETASQGITTGWAGVIVSGNVRGQGIFRQRIAGRPDFESVVPMLSWAQPVCIIPFPTQPTAMLAMAFDNTNGNVTSVAFANTATAPRTLDLEFVDQGGVRLILAHESMASHNQLAFATTDRYPVVANQKGWMRVLTSPSDFTALGFRFNPTGAFTTWLPVLG